MGEPLQAAKCLPYRRPLVQPGHRFALLLVVYCLGSTCRVTAQDKAGVSFWQHHLNAVDCATAERRDKDPESFDGARAQRLRGRLLGIWVSLGLDFCHGSDYG